MQYALIGCGRIATNHIKAATVSGMEIIALCDILPENSNALSKAHNLPETVRHYTDYKEMLKNQKPTLAAIATESGKHAEIAIDCINAGVNVIIEKPIALSLEDADNIIKAAEENNVIVCACHQNRFNPSIQHIKKALDLGRFGNISHGSVHVRWARDEHYYKQAPWRGTWAQDGGVLMNQSIHSMDIFRWLMGDIDEVFAYTANRQHPYIECEDVGMAVVKFKNGAIGTVEGTSNVYPKNLEETLYIFGQNGTAKAGGKSLNTIDVWQFADVRDVDKELANGLHEQTANVYGNGHIELYKDVYAAIKENRQPYVDGKAGRDALEFVLAVYKSAAEGVGVRL